MTATGSPCVVGVLKEVKGFERRVALTPAGAAALVGDGHRVLVETEAGLGSGFKDAEYTAVGAEIAASADRVFVEATLLLHVKEPQPQEFDKFRPHHTLFTYLHLAAAPEVADALCRSGCRAIAYESVEIDRQLPLLAPMSMVAGRLATQIAASYLEARLGGRGMLMGGLPGVEPTTVVVIGAGTSGRHAAEVAAGMGAEVVVADLDIDRARSVAATCGPLARAVVSTPAMIEELAPTAEVMIGAVLAPGHRAPIVITRRVLDLMPEGSVVVDIAIDQGGCVEGVVSTTHADPVRTMGHVRVSATPNMPAAVPRSSTAALTVATLPYVRALANGWEVAVATHPELAGAVNIENGTVIHPDVRDALGL
ncbi:MAG: alanine dehydrogenase [Actinomycetota bacterium]|jgi:alanine dehydrogenase